jgi:vitamin B12 transporter
VFRLCAIAALATVLSGALAAQQADSTRLPRVVVTATRLHSPIGGNIASVSVLHGDSLRARGVRDVAEALREVPGASVVRSGSYGAQTALFLRGAENDYVRVLVDGVAMNEPGGSIDLAAYTIDNVDRIEVVRGPASVLYGSDAVAGVVQIFTRRARGEAQVDASVSGATFGTRLADVSLGARRGAVDATLGASQRQSDGILAFNNGWEQSVLSGRVAYAPHASFSATLTGRRLHDEFHYPTDGAGEVTDHNAYRRDRRDALALDLEQQIVPRVRMQLSVTAMEGRPRTDDAADGPSDTSGFHAYRSSGSLRRRTADTRLSVQLATGAIAVLGHEWQREAQRGRDSSNFDTAPNRFAADRTTRATYAQLLGERGAWSASLGARYDDNDVYGIFRTARVGLAWRAGSATTLRGSAGSAFKAPTFLEQFNTAFTVGNRDLRPERSRSVEIGITHALAGGRSELAATWFAQRFRDLIQYSYVDPVTPNYTNVAAASARGLELESRSLVGATQITAGLTFLRTRVDDAGVQRGEEATFVQGRRLLRRPSVMGSLSAVSRLTPRLETDARLLVVGARDDRDFSGFPARPVVLPAYQRVDAGIAYRVSATPRASLIVFLRAENLFAERYEEIANFASPGRSIALGLRAQAAK